MDVDPNLFDPALDVIEQAWSQHDAQVLENLMVFVLLPLFGYGYMSRLPLLMVVTGGLLVWGVVTLLR